MLVQVHDHIVSELSDSSRTDRIFVLTAIAFNLIVLGINAGVSAGAAEARTTVVFDLVLIVFIVMTVLLNIIAASALFMGRRTRLLLLDGLIAMYHDNEVDRYYDPSLLANYGMRYILFTAVIVILAMTAIVVPLIIRFS